MSSNAILTSLNEAQRAAVSAQLGSSLVLAGAGTGKTRVLTHRVAWLVSEHRMPLSSILAVTFTNKAAGEMRERISRLIGSEVSGRWIGTFHSIALRLLRQHKHEAGLPEDFEIIDSNDQLRIIKSLQNDMNISVDKVNPRNTRAYISRQKEAGRRVKNALGLKLAYEPEYLRVYEAYEARCEREGLVDFGEMLLRSLEMLREHDTLLRLYRQMLGNVLVDEFQDTNAIQYDWLKLIASEAASTMAVGDDDQSIYGWRGAEVGNMNSFIADFDQVQVHRLEQNYRSTEHILQAANAVIGHNQGRLGKKLWTEQGSGARIGIYRAINEHQEADEVARMIRRHLSDGDSYQDIAVLYRTHALSRVLERSLSQQGIPYRIYGGLRFFERAEVKDSLAYMRLVATPDSDFAFARVVNTPTRSIGPKTLDRLRVLATERGISLHRMAEAAIVQRLLPARAMNALQTFLSLLANMRRASEGLSLAETADTCIKMSGLMQFHAPDATEQSLGRRDNLEELVNACVQFAENPMLVLDADGEEITSLTPESELRNFLDHVSLGDETADAQDPSEKVRLMTVHSAKGLEFPVLFMVGVEDGLFPNSRAIEEGGLEEERRLFYVGMTRAMRTLRLSYSEVRTRYQGSSASIPSRFLAELPDSNVDRQFLEAAPWRGSGHRSRTYDGRSRVVEDAPDVGQAGLRSGAMVKHAKFGEGIVLAVEGTGDNARLQVRFNRAGTKWLVLGYAKLQLVGS